MSQIRGSDTKPEIFLRKFLWRMGYRYRIRNKLPGKPDLVFSRKKIAVFIDGCFWHKCPEHFVPPRTRAEFWAEKINGNVRRDHKNNEVLKSQGWQVIRIWEHEIKESLESSVARIVEALEKQKNAHGFRDY